MKVELSKRAWRSIEKIQAWWVENRPAAPTLFLDELAEVEEVLRTTPEAGAVYATHRSGVVRRLTMPKTRHQLYYRYTHESRRLIVLAVWGAPRERGPLL